MLFVQIHDCIKPTSITMHCETYKVANYIISRRGQDTIFSAHEQTIGSAIEQVVKLDKSVMAVSVG